MADDFDRIKRNVQKMLSMNAPEADIDGYLGQENLTPDEFKLVATGKAKLGDIRMTQKSQAAMAAPPKPEMSQTDARLATFSQGAYQNFGDELIGAIEAAKSGFEPGVYTRSRDEARRWLEGAEAQAPGFSVAGQITTGLPAALATGGTSLTGTVAAGSGLGGVSAYGATEANDMKGLMDTLAGAGMGGAFAGVGYPLVQFQCSKLDSAI